MVLVSLLLSCLTGDLRINEIMAAPQPALLEFVEVVNVSASAIDLGDLALEDATGRLVRLAPPGVLLSPGGLVSLVRDASAFAARWPGVPYLRVQPWPVLRDEGGTVTIARDSTPVESVSYDGDWSPRGRSLERRDPCGPASHPTAWAPSVDPEGATPGRTNSRYRPDREPPRATWSEVLEPGVVRVWFDEPVVSVEISTPDGRVARVVADPGGMTFDVEVSGPLPALLDVVGAEDAAGNRGGGQSIPVGRPPAGGDLRLSEVLFAPLEDPFDGRPEGIAFVELASLARHPVSLRGLRLAGRARDDGTRPASSPASVPPGVLPGQRAILFRRPTVSAVDAHAWDTTWGWVDGVDAAARAEFRTAYPDAGATLLPVDGWPFGRSLGRVVLISAEGAVIDSADVFDAWYDGPARGRSMERVDPDLVARSPASWAASTHATGATPGAPNAVEALPRGQPAFPGDVAITEILFDVASADVRPEFVEWEITASHSVDPNGWSLQTGTDPSDLDSVRIAWAPAAWSPGTFSVAAGTSDPFQDLWTAFPGARGRLSPERSVPLRSPLRNGWGRVRIVDASGVVLDETVYDAAYHHQAIGSGRGVSLERFDPLGPSRDPSNWGSSTHPDGGTPGYRDGVQPVRDAGDPVLDVSPRVFTPRDPSGTGYATIRARLHDGAWSVRISVHDLSGRLVRTLAHGSIAYGTEVRYWDGRLEGGHEAPPGPYVVFVEGADSQGRRRTRKAVVIRGQ